MGKVRTMKKTKSSNKVSRKHKKRGVKHIKRKMKKSVIKRKSKSKTKSKTKPKKKSKSKSKTMKGGNFIMETLGLTKPSLENLKSDLQGELTGLKTINTYSEQDKKDSEKIHAYYKISKFLGKLDKHYPDEAHGEKLNVNRHFSGTGAQDKQHYNTQTQQISSKTIDSYDGLGSALKSVFEVPGIV